MDQKDWELLEVLAEEKSITQAAKRLFFSQPALSGKMLQALGPAQRRPMGIRDQSSRFPETRRRRTAETRDRSAIDPAAEAGSIEALGPAHFVLLGGSRQRASIAAWPHTVTAC